MVSQNKKPLKHLIEISLLVSLSMIIQMIETPIPRPLPWIKPGMVNVVTILTLSLFGLKEALFISLIRVFLGSLLLGTFLGPGFFLSLSGGLASTFVMGVVLIIFGRKFSLIGVSILGALSHNLSQLCVAYLLFFKQLHLSLNNLSYILVLMLFWAVITGFFVGYLARILLPIFLQSRKQFTEPDL